MTPGCDGKPYLEPPPKLRARAGGGHVGRCRKGCRWVAARILPRSPLPVACLPQHCLAMASQTWALLLLGLGALLVAGATPGLDGSKLDIKGQDIVDQVGGRQGEGWEALVCSGAQGQGAAPQQDLQDTGLQA